MDKPLTPIQELDEVLSVIRTIKPDPTDGDIFSALQKKIPDLKNQPYLGTELLMVLDKLVRDGFVRQYIRNRNTDPKLRYALTFEGAVHLERGGYAGQQEQRFSVA